MLCATSLGRALAQDERAIVDLYGGALLTGDLEGSVDRLERLLAEHDVAEAFAIVASVSRLPGRSRLRLRLQPGLARGAKRTASSSTAESDAGLSALVQTDAVVPTAAALEIPTPMLPAFDERPPLFEGLRDWAIDLAELFSGSRQQRATASDARRTALAAPGALSVRRYRESSGLPPEWRANLPRGPSVHVPVRLLAVSLFLFIAVGGTGFALDQQRDREARAGAALVAVDTALMRARENPGTAMTSVAEAEAAVAEARDAGATGDALVRREQELARVRDDVWGILRLADVMRVGSLPAEASEGSVRLALAGETLYLAAGSLYELDPEQGTARHPVGATETPSMVDPPATFAMSRSTAATSSPRWRRDLCARQIGPLAAPAARGGRRRWIAARCAGDRLGRRGVWSFPGRRSGPLRSGVR